MYAGNLKSERVTQKVAGPGKNAEIRRTKGLGSSVGCNLLPPCIRNPYKKVTNTE